MPPRPLVAATAPRSRRACCCWAWLESLKADWPQWVTVFHPRLFHFQTTSDATLSLHEECHGVKAQIVNEANNLDYTVSDFSPSPKLRHLRGRGKRHCIRGTIIYDVAAHSFWINVMLILILWPRCLLATRTLSVISTRTQILLLRIP